MKYLLIILLLSSCVVREVQARYVLMEVTKIENGWATFEDGRGVVLSVEIKGMDQIKVGYKGWYLMTK